MAIKCILKYFQQDGATLHKQWNVIGCYKARKEIGHQWMKFFVMRSVVGKVVSANLR